MTAQQLDEYPFNEKHRYNALVESEFNGERLRCVYSRLRGPNGVATLL